MVPGDIRLALDDLARALSVFPRPVEGSWASDQSWYESEKLEFYFTRTSKPAVTVEGMHEASVAHELTFLSKEAFLYLLPTLLRLAAEELVAGRGTDVVSVYVETQLELSSENHWNDRFSMMTAEQLSAIRTVIEALAEYQGQNDLPTGGWSWKELLEWHWKDRKHRDSGTTNNP